MNNNLDELMEKVKFNIELTYKRLKTELFENSGKILGHRWEDLTIKYQDRKRKKYGFVYPIGIRTGKLSDGAVEKMLVVDVFYNEFEDKIDFSMDVDTDRIGLDYADAFNDTKNRNFVTITPDEKKIFYNVVANTIQDYFGTTQ